MDKIFSIYRSSAGSGKTRTLAKEYLQLALQFNSDYFRHILAVTFTNKATQEMKDRILNYLDDFANDRPNELATELKTILKLDDSTFQERSVEVQSCLLHQYSQFSISTIDAFFQQVIRSFTREAGLMGDYRLEVDGDAVLEEVVDNLIDELGSDPELTHWVIEFAKDNLENERAWDVRYNLIEFAREIFREDFKIIEEDVNKLTSDRLFFKERRNDLLKIKQSFLSRITKPAAEAMQIISQQDWDVNDISYGKNSGLITFFETFALAKNVRDLYSPKDRVRNYFTNPFNWPGKKTKHSASIIAIAESKLVPILNDILQTYDEHSEKALSAEVVLRHMYVFGLLSDISRKLKEYKDENNMMLLSDAPKFLNGVIQDSDTPFIYEKVGSFYRNYLIDEFQDTSELQWKNFLPLVSNGLDQGYPSLVVGDVKQGIYRWRGGDLNLLQNQVESHIGSERVDTKELVSNFRSALNVVHFNNLFFKEASQWVAKQTGNEVSTSAYQDVTQQVVKEYDGLVHVSFISKSGEEGEWKNIAKENIPRWLEDLQEAGIPLKDIAILVRMNSEGQQIANYLLDYRNSEKAKPGCRYDVISNESLRLDGAASVNLMLAAMKYLLNPLDAVARAQLAYEYYKLNDSGKDIYEVFKVTDQVFFEYHLPDTFTKGKAYLKKLPLFELTETLINIFSLDRIQGEFTYLQAFQDVVSEFYTRERNDLGAFLEWWELNKNKKSIQVSGEVDAVRIITVHKSKGLQFNYVLVPFCSWHLDHEPRNAPNLWVKSDRTPFDQMGFFPVKYGKTLQSTYFKDNYEEEHARTYLDNLNLLYVALTRAEQGLIVMAPHPDSQKTKTVAKILYECITQCEELNKNLKADYDFVLGTIQRKEKVEEPILNPLELLTYHSSSWRKKLVIRQSAKNYFDEEADEIKIKTSYGIHLHTILSRIKYAEDLEEALKEMVLEGLITGEELADLNNQIRALLGDQLIASWFSREWDVRTEVPILLPDGSENRVDRLMIKDKRAIVVDFKTGEPYASDRQQVQDYMKILRRMNFIEVEGYLLYLNDGNVVVVKSDRQRIKVGKFKDESQLGLGLD